MPRPLPYLAAPVVRSICLSPGQTLRIWLPAGATLVCNGPALTIAGAPQWLAGQWLQPRQALGDGQSLWLEQGGWSQIEAVCGGELLIQSALAGRWPARIGHAMRYLAQRLRGMTRGKRLSGVSKTG